ncbi:replication initiation protein [Pseudomonas luteola]|uniref:replication initiation protein n=1 Tax=Pseudomonas luteola TaxID=47886 RepID=UPI003A84EE6A
MAAVGKPAKTSRRVYKSNSLNEGSMKMGLQEYRLLLLAISYVNSKRPIKKTEQFVITAKDFGQQYHIDPRNAYTVLAEAADRLFDREVQTVDAQGHVTRFRILDSKADYLDGKGCVKLRFGQTFAPYISRLYKAFTSYELRRVSELTSFHSMRLFEMTQQYRKTGVYTVSLETLRLRFELGDSYQRFNNLRERIIDPAIDELNTKAGLKIDYTTHSEGRKVVKLTFRFHDMMTPALEATGDLFDNEPTPEGD